ncbi:MULTISPECIES: DNA topoisomerase IV subunit B [Flavobacteriaceae]|jgi:topoisomerase-4 subunit B|uniref:DNA topoisomerase (ATP-hydrolyzing) n=1 Tax=Flagellimonas sp. MMG031 TaxID=3158549 RepID=A0AAU7MUW7_9FLAO|nr:MULTISPECIES: DNA topoisomerase IV subunit B [unclassified Allomuricauda]MBO6532144.1 type IIA DNA topoisomerase subunit B [Allomuricauda sp.]MBO6590139.1 type IIA DNA topoisomerase subunit B [Allomuricauda sp.]MBO6619713.1 type IIA DNA topoisomerase subunit B [Allomuricauda sp.]MBO6645660.1 type IIA DNA topoisomerase subunit B [Allomuricauda sp.]MBO6748051.1 type IIA DNA topoisomerase subunit B [Allomuricauda sp.]
MADTQYTEDNIRSLDWKEHIRMRPGMYIGKLGDGSSADDGIYILLKEVIDNCIDEFVMGAGKTIEINIKDNTVHVRDYGRGIPLGKVVDVVSKMNTGGKYDTRAFKKSVGLNGVGTKAVNALSTYFRVESNRDGKSKSAEFETGNLINEELLEESSRRKGTKVSFTPDETIFKKYKYRNEYVERMLRNYVYLNPGLTIVFNGEKFYSENGLKDLLEDNNNEDDFLYPIIHLKGDDIEVAMTHSKTQYSEEYHSFVNGQHTTQGGTHQSAFREAVVKTIRDFYGKNYDASDVRKSIISAVSIKVMEPVFESQTKTKLGSTDMGGDLPTVRTFINDFVGTQLDNYLHKNPQTAEALQKKIVQAEKERKELSGIRKLARERAKKASLHNKKLRDCRIHLQDMKKDRRLETTLFITEGDSASGSITKSRDVNTQAVFSLRGKPLNSYGMSKKIVYENEEFNLLQAALNIEDSMEDLRYNNIVIATDADVDGMHIRLLLITFFLQFFPELIKENHLYILQTPLFRVRNKKETIYCYSEEERRQAIEKLSGKPEITRFKGLGEISPDEFKNFIGDDIRLEPVMLDKAMSIDALLKFYMGKNTPDRQDFIINNLKVELDLVEENQLQPK